ncbi:hypothetical protein BJ973_009455 [Actinoplanes tereljensis]|uniref:Uncharacterized protein n=1 Tax=Paractinoplanes tereljensis TaxID=571912 RepID=A0A919NG77_9ACTN|nr:hypothetical protein [Actinoplanes tereljensis]GIF17580.1 hypothetical protein Ate02nite_03100 [Actinoplanes tereljensis]
MTHPTDDGVWRDEQKLPLSELDQAMATWDTDGQNDPSDNETGAEPTDDEPSTTGHTGPN